MSIEDYLAKTLQQLEHVYAQMDKATGNLLFRDFGPYKQFRHETPTESLACYLKGVKTISTLNRLLKKSPKASNFRDANPSDSPFDN